MKEYIRIQEKYIEALKHKYNQDKREVSLIINAISVIKAKNVMHHT